MSRRELSQKDLFEMIANPAFNMEWDNTVLVTGRERGGKSTFCIREASEFQGCSLKSAILNNIIYSPNDKEIEKKIKDKKLKVTVADEIIKAMLNTEFHSSIARFLVKLFNVCGSENKVNFIVLPRKSDLLKAIRQGRCFYWIHIAFRGVAIVFQYDSFGLSIDGWHTKENDKILKKALGKDKKISDISVDKELELYSKSINYVGEFYFDDLPAEEKALYGELKEKNKYLGLRKKEDDYSNLSERSRDYILAISRLILFLYSSKTLTLTKIAEIASWSVQRVSSILNRYKKFLRKREDKLLKANFK